MNVGRVLTAFLENHNLLSPSQFGFRKKHNTLHPLVHFMNFISSGQNNYEFTLAIFCDLCKAFDTVNHPILFLKLSKLGIHGLELKWFESYLSDGKQSVHNNGVSSNLLCILLGVPQGSILGPLLFLIYINDLPGCSKLCAYLFADDTPLLAKNANLNKLFSDVNEEFRKVVYYFRAHRVVLHPDKTTFMLFSTANADTVNNKIYIDNNNYAEAHYNPDLKSAIRCVNNLDAAKVKFLGVLIDPNLNFCFHIKAISAKLSSALFHLRAVKSMLLQKALTALYYSLYHSHLIYAVRIWSSTAPSIIKELVKKAKAGNSYYSECCLQCSY